MRSRMVGIALMVVTIFSSDRLTATATEQGRSTDFYTPLAGQLPPLFDGTADAKPFSDRLSNIGEELQGFPQLPSNIEVAPVSLQSFVQLRPAHPTEKDVLVTHLFHTSRYLHGELLVFEPDDETAPTTPTTVNEMIEDDDLGIVASVRLSF